MMVALGSGVQALAGPLRRAVPVAMSVVIIALGLHALVGRAGVSLAGMTAAARAATPGGERADSAGAPPSRGLAAEALGRVGEHPLPCCAEDAP
jgi:hypothetical protein